ncbi:MAG: RNA polymerase sigma factor [Paraclostridium sp.]|uniref:RNA polymerase sigma factor n=1 Tax=Paraclostridium sp. TaxID=2023273 RepID=UPI003EE56966
MSSLKYLKISKLVSKCKNGDSQAFSDLYSLTYQKVYFLSLSILKDQPMAEDAVQEVFLIVLRSLDKLESPKLFVAWINKITYNYCIKELYKVKKLGEVHSDHVLPTLSDNSNDVDPVESYILKESNTELMNLINKLSSIHSTVLILKYFDELKVSEIAYVLSISEGTVKSRLNNAKKNLYKLYSEERTDNRKIYGFMLFTFFKKASNENLLNLSSSKNILGNVLYKSHFNIGKSFKFKINTKQGMPKSMVVSLTSSIIVSTSVLGLYEITKHDFSNASNLSTKSNLLDNINISISDTSKITNKPILVDIQIKDKSLVNDLYIKLDNSEKLLGSYINQSTYRFKITKNGDYKVFVNLKRHSTLVKEFKINCIDTESPNIINYTYDNDKIIISLKDSSSEIDFNKIYLKDSNGKILNIQSIDKDKGIIVVKIINLPLYLTIYDSVGNKAVYNIKKA